MDGVWKVADFGISAEGTTSRAQSTVGRRGTTGYRAPEIVKEDNAAFTNKVDIFAFGCILYEMAFRKKLFGTDYSLVAYVYTEKLPLSITRDTGPVDEFKITAEINRLKYIINATLELNPSRRPKAQPLRAACAAIALGHSYHYKRLEGFGPELLSRVLTDPQRMLACTESLTITLTISVE